ncbi:MULTISPECIES: lysine--tRNA ligase [Desulfococcus]|jgi:lysyl-tRNA synthetase class 2|uniref:Lysine--tRNA ligase n=1 Tax=Desulfococcus multivorans DSM 2059 TaxID=1121405 RepID=S7TF40_DESML|nr:lysine--tRNA ligase [Desulfococcus multivorans]AOY58666.1 LysS2: lysyl-tRNA synthetase [Desulfococcus multivorans]AQV00956.1 lysine--tRNA ligase [Desulfococcus multivorans]EPR35321.1 Lysyl-tRNA synthetase [Desulfococcus multivorans DSM 2059]SJZ45953.1 lysyl-tRNA synthetase, class II [Desulfococcus multivorans DSM 2059]
MEKSDVLLKRKQKISELKEMGVNLYPNDFKVSHEVLDIRRLSETQPGIAARETTVFSVAGRIMAVNRFGKSAFIRFKDQSGQLQAYVRQDKVGTDGYTLFKQMDVGDFVGLVGTLFQTKTGEWTLLASQVRLLSKAVRPLPEKFHGLKDPEKRYRRRYVDLIMNPEVRDIFVKRSRIIQAVRTFLLDRNYLEVETPMMQPIPGGAEAEPFVTHHNALGMDLYLRIAPELYLKRLVVGGFERVFEINRNFRNEGVSTQHNPEFTMVEFYQAYATFTDLMALTEEMFADVAETVTGSTRITYQGSEIDFAKGWRRMTLAESLEKIGGVAPDILNDKEKLLALAADKGIKMTKTGRLGKVITKLFDALVEPELIQPTFITGYPVEVSPLSRRSDTSPELTERFELFIAGREIANGFSELNDPEDQKERFLQQVADRDAGDKEAHFMDEDYIEALEYGMPPTAGEGIGIDRLAMLLTDAASIREVILFPHMKTK